MEKDYFSKLRPAAENEILMETSPEIAKSEAARAFGNGALFIEAEKNKGIASYFRNIKNIY